MTRSPKKGRAPRLTLADLAQHQRITCMLCGSDKPAQGARRFRAHHVCAECVMRLETKPQDAVGNDVQQKI